MAKWGKIGAPKSAKRRAWLASLRRRRKGASPKRKTRAAKPKRRKRKIARRKRRRRSGFSISSMFKFVRLAALAYPGVDIAVRQKRPVSEAIGVYAGISPTTHSFDWATVKFAYTPLLAATLLTYGIPKLSGLIRRL